MITDQQLQYNDINRLLVLYGREAQAVPACLVTFTNWALTGLMKVCSCHPILVSASVYLSSVLICIRGLSSVSCCRCLEQTIWPAVH